MTFLPTEIGELEEVRQRHDAFMEQGRLELIADGVPAQADQGRADWLHAIEQQVPEIDFTIDSFEA